MLVTNFEAAKIKTVGFMRFRMESGNTNSLHSTGGNILSYHLFAEIVNLPSVLCSAETNFSLKQICIAFVSLYLFQSFANLYCICVTVLRLYFSLLQICIAFVSLYSDCISTMDGWAMIHFTQDFSCLYAQKLTFFLFL